MKSLPPTAKPDSRTDTFTEETLPKGLLKDHSLRKGYWGRITIEEGQLEYVIQGPPQETHVLSPEKFGVVEPEMKHHVRPLSKVRFYVQFYKEQE